MSLKVVDLALASEETVKTLEEYLVEARAGRIRDVALVATVAGSTGEMSFACSNPSFAILGGLHFLADEVSTRIRVNSTE